MPRPFSFLAASLLAILIATPASAQTPPDLSDLVGARGAGGETQMEARGYRFVRTTTARDRKWSVWWNDRIRTCAQIATSDGRYATINRVPEAVCGQSSGYPPPPPRGDDRPSYGDRPDYRGDDRGRPDDDRNGYRDGYDRGGALTLICYGEGRKPGAEYRSGYVWNDRRKRYEFGSAIVNGQQAFDSEVQVELRDGRGRIHLSGKLVAPIHSGGRDGWWDLQDLRVEATRITGRYRLNGLNSPRVNIDRQSGRIAIDGIEHYRGSCDIGDWSGGRNRF